MQQIGQIGFTVIDWDNDRDLRQGNLRQANVHQAGSIKQAPLGFPLHRVLIEITGACNRDCLQYFYSIYRGWLESGDFMAA